MSKEVYRRLSKAERKLENTNRLRTNNSTLRIKYEGVKKLLEKKDKEIERLNNIINELEKRLEQAIEDNKKEYSLKSQMAVFVLRDTLELIEELKGSE